MEDLEKVQLCRTKQIKGFEKFSKNKEYSVQSTYDTTKMDGLG